jgi:hypothetical protein
MTRTPPESDREAWLSTAAELLLMALPVDVEKYRVSVGFPAGTRSRKRIGFAYPAQQSSDGHAEIFISPEQDSPSAILPALAACMLRVGLANDTKRGAVITAARAIGLLGDLDCPAMAPGSPIAIAAEFATDTLGEFPGRALVINPAKQAARQLRIQCTDTSCEFVFRTSAKQWARVNSGRAHCPVCDRKHTLQQFDRPS